MTNYKTTWTFLQKKKKTTWTKENFLDYVRTTLQGDALHLLKQWKISEEGKAQKIALLSNFLEHDEILREFSKIKLNTQKKRIAPIQRQYLVKIF